MNCVDFEDHWNEILDARPVGPSELERRLEEHAVSCASCRAISTRYQTLRQVVGALGPPPAPSAESSSRLLALMLAAPVPARHRPDRRPARFAWVPLATAAAVLLIARPDGTPRREPIAPSMTIATSPRTGASSRPLDSALVAAKRATIELALEASAPATRIGREVLADRDRGDDFDSTPGGRIVDDLGTPPADLIETVGKRFTAGVRPISGSARHAFGFLLGPPPSPPAQKSL